MTTDPTARRTVRAGLERHEATERLRLGYGARIARAALRLAGDPGDYASAADYHRTVDSAAARIAAGGR